MGRIIAYDCEPDTLYVGNYVEYVLKNCLIFKNAWKIYHHVNYIISCDHDTDLERLTSDEAQNLMRNLQTLMELSRTWENSNVGGLYIKQPHLISFITFVLGSQILTSIVVEFM